MTSNHKKIVLALLAAEILATIEITMIYAALRYLVEEFGSPEAIGWTITGFLLTSAVSAALCGRLGDIYDRKRLLLGAIGLSIVGSLIAGSSTTLTGVVIGRTIQGCAGAIFPLCVGILREHIERDKLPMYIGVLTAIMTVSGGLGMLFGGLIVDHLTWHWIFYTTALIGVIAGVWVYLVVPASSTRQAEPGVNYFGGVLFAPGTACLLLGLTKAKDWGVTDSATLSLVAVGMLLLLAWIWSELKAKVPLLNIRMLLDRDILFASVGTVLFGLTWMQFGQTWSLLLQQPATTGAGLGLSASVAGLIMQPQTLMALVGGPLSGWFFIRYGARLSAAFGASLLASAWIAAIIHHESIAFVVLLMIVMGAGSAFLASLLIAIVAHAAPANRTSEAVGMLALFRSIGNSVGAIVVFGLLGSSTVPGPTGRGVFPDARAYDLTMGYIAGGLLLITFIYLALYKPRAAAQAVRPPEPA